MTSVRKTAVIALGSNLAEPQQQVAAAIAAIAALDDVQVLHSSSLYQTKPVGYAAQPDFVNAVMAITTSLSAHALLGALQQIENRFGRVRSFRNAPRTLDLDVIDYHGERINSADLQLPHPRAHLRQFVMVPLAEIMPDYVLPGHGRAADIAAQLRQSAPADEVLRLPENKAG